MKEGLQLNLIKSAIKKQTINAELLEACEDAKRQIAMMIERMPLNKLAASDSIMISQLQQTINKAKE